MLYNFDYVATSDGKTGKPDQTGHGKCLGAYTGWYNEKHYTDGLVSEGWFEEGNNVYYAEKGNVVTGDVVIDGIKYLFSNTAGSPAETDRGALIGRYYNISFVNEGVVVSELDYLKVQVLLHLQLP